MDGVIPERESRACFRKYGASLCIVRKALLSINHRTQMKPNRKQESTLYPAPHGHRLAAVLHLRVFLSVTTASGHDRLNKCKFSYGRHNNSKLDNLIWWRGR